jgi:fatty acid-binding protein DegV
MAQETQYTGGLALQGSFFTVDTLEHLVRHGHIGKAASMLGTMMSVKPIVSIIDGEVTPVAKAYGRGSILPRVIELMGEKIGPAQPIHGRVNQRTLQGKMLQPSRVQLHTGNRRLRLGCSPRA